MYCMCICTCLLNISFTMGIMLLSWSLQISSSICSSMCLSGEGTNGAGNHHLSRQNCNEWQVTPVVDEPCDHTIDCGDIVWGLAFGSSVPEKQSRCVNIEWHRFKFGQDQLLLATGLNNGRIKIWDVYTGE